jgi:hypothetical protein|tara:strand:- start:7768 stop:9000 length:1233 start_codon:yes stop_codon:yes gene_type:complete
MGASQSNNKYKKNLVDVIDHLATEYIVTQTFQDMINLRDPDYCNNLVILTSDIINNNFNQKQVRYLYEKNINGVKVNEIKEDSLFWIKSENLDNLYTKDNISKKNLCIGIAKQYIKIAHLFAAIVTTINPTYTYKDIYGNQTLTVGIQDKHKIPLYAQTKLKEINICSKRIDALVNGKNLKLEKINIQPDFCSINAKSNNETRSLIEEPGIPELEMLYYDVYDYNSGQFIDMSTNMKKKYDSDVELFYKEFTGNSYKPANVKTFSDITLRDFSNYEECQTKSDYRESYQGVKSDNLFGKYAKHVKTMIANAQTNQNALLNILDRLFVWLVIEGDAKKKISINPNINEKNLELLISEARNIITKCYITCEKDFMKGLEIFEAIVEKQIMNVTQSQIDRLDRAIQNKVALGL